MWSRTQIRLREAKERSERFHAEQTELERELQRIAENEESIQMELETSENLEQELNQAIEKLQRILDDEKEEESVQLKESEKVHLALAGFEQQHAFIEENISRIRKKLKSLRQN